MSKAIKLGIIGAGSATFSLGLVRDLCCSDVLYGSTIMLMDINEERLNSIHNLATRYVDELKIDLKFEKTLSREAALKDADFVINTALFGGHDQHEAGRAVGDKHGYYRGAPGMNYNQLRFMLSVAKDMEAICPDAWLIQSSNPVFDGCTLMTRKTNTKVVGLCHGHYGYHGIARVLGLDLAHVECQAVGFNHIIYMTHFLYKGEDAYPLIDEWIETKAEEYWCTHKLGHDAQLSPAAVHQYKMIGLFPIGDTPRRGGWWYHINLETKKRWYGEIGGFDSEIGWTQYLDGLAKRVDHIMKVANDVSISVTKEFPPHRSGEQQLGIIEGLALNKEGKFQVNIPNNGLIKDIPDDVVVEVPAMVNKTGIHGIQVGKLPKNLLLQVLWPRMLDMENNLELALSSDKRLFLRMILDDHRTKSLEQAEAFIEDFLSMPFNREMAENMAKNAIPPREA
ncbi:alpha-glucosidase/alpha-galactosidase [Candidatus Poribacteria bacterium]|nr:alpha-glucosidase/alpha-galactosidase [Candidatus Poribacteria bacterium]